MHRHPPDSIWSRETLLVGKKSPSQKMIATHKTQQPTFRHSPHPSSSNFKKKETMKDTRQQQQQQQHVQQGRRQQANNLTAYYPAFGSQINAEQAPVGRQHSKALLRDLLLTMTPAEGRDIGTQRSMPSLWFETPETRRIVEGMSQEEKRARTVNIVEAALSLVEDDEDLFRD
jgi:hypothetical protein